MSTAKTRNSLQAVLDRQSTALSDPAASASEVKPPGMEGAELDSAGMPGSARPSRQGKRLVAGHFPPAVAKQLKVLAAEEETSIQALLEEALNLLFVKKGKGHVGRF